MLNSWVEEFGSFIAEETSKLIRTCAKPKGEGLVEKLTQNFLENMIENVVMDALTKHADLPPHQAYSATKDAVAQAKSNIQTAIAIGFEKAFHKFSGREVEYYCQIHLVPEPINKEFC